MKKFLGKSEILDFDNEIIKELFSEKTWLGMSKKDCIISIYNFVKDEIKFGYNKSDKLKASDILKDGYGQCNTKGLLLMALFRKASIPCRIHGFYVDKSLQKGILKSFYYSLAPQKILHSWIEIEYEGKWYNMEGFILDKSYLENIQKSYVGNNTEFCAYGIASKCAKNPTVYWDENDTYIQKESIVEDLGVFDTPDEFLNKYKQNIGFFKEILYKYVIRKLMNKNVEKIRKNMEVI